ncbi:MAG: hypothetical protein ABI718_02470 [Acidobacteriota bacterium]
MSRQSRKAYRFRIVNPIPARFNGVPILVCDLADGGLQIEHTDAFVRGSSGLVEYTIPGKTKKIRVHGTLVWTRVADQLSDPPVYRSGVKVEGHVDALNSTIDFFLRSGIAKIDRGWREPTAKPGEKPAAEKPSSESTAAAPTSPAAPAGEITEEVILLIEEAREQLARSYEESLKWYQRARFSLSEESVQKETQDIHHREDVLAVWEFLGRSVEIATIASVFDRRR